MRPAPSDPPEVEAVLWAGWSGDLAWDVGANTGQSLWHLTRAFRQVWAFEPAAESFTVLKAGWGGDDRVTLRNVAVSSHEGTLTVSEREHSISKGELTVAADMPEQSLGLPPQAALPWGRETGRRDVPCVTLDGVAAASGRVPDFVKVDTEGHEGQVLAGAKDLLTAGGTGWLIEFHTAPLMHECARLLQDAGYEPEVVRHPHYAPGGRMWNSHGWLRAAAPR